MAMRRLPSIVLLLPCLVLTGCVAFTPTLKDLEARANDRLFRIEEIGATGAKDPAEAVRRLDEFIVEANVDRSFEEYNKRLQSELKNLTESEFNTISDNAVSGFPFIYQRRLDQLAQARRMHAALDRKRNDAAGAERHLKKSIELQNRFALSPVSRAASNIESYRMLQELYEQAGRKGEALVARLDADMLDDYLRSPQGVADFYTDRIAYVDTVDQMHQLDKQIGKENRRRADISNQQAMQVLGATMQMASSFQQMQMDRMGASMPSSQLDMLKTNKMLLDFSMQLLDATSLKGGTGVDVVSNPFSNVTIVQQLVNPRMGVNTHGILRDFVTTAAALPGGGKVRQAADDMLGMIDALKALRHGGDIRTIIGQVQTFSDRFSSFESLVRDLR